MKKFIIFMLGFLTGTLSVAGFSFLCVERESRKMADDVEEIDDFDYNLDE